jgi:hypothetical protein
MLVIALCSTNNLSVRLDPSHCREQLVSARVELVGYSAPPSASPFLALPSRSATYTVCPHPVHSLLGHWWKTNPWPHKPAARDDRRRSRGLLLITSPEANTMGPGHENPQNRLKNSRAIRCFLTWNAYRGEVLTRGIGKQKGIAPGLAER